MALISPIHGEMSGSIAGNTWSHNRGGQYVRQRRTTSNPMTERQTAVRGWLSTASNKWRDLTEAQRTAWKNWAAANPVINRLGQSIQLSGHSAYNMLNTRILDRGGAVSTQPPTTAGPFLLVSFSGVVSASAGTLVLTYATTPTGGGKRIAVWSTGAGRTSQDPNRNQAKLIAYSAVNAASPQTFVLPYSVGVGDAINFWVAFLQDDGRMSTFKKLRVVVTA